VTVSKMRGPTGPLKKHGIPQQLNKQAMAAALFHVVSRKVEDSGGRINFDDGLVLARVMHHDGTVPLADQVSFLRVAPTDASLAHHKAIRTSRGKNKLDARTTTASLTVIEFARLVCFLVNDEQVRAALLKSGLELTHSELDSRAHRDEFWVKFVEPKTNDTSQHASLPGRNLPHCLMNVDPNAPAVQFRTGDFLKRKFYESRASFTQWRMNWSQSGNYDVDSFERYVAQPPPGSTYFPIVSLCAIILFHTTRCGEKDSADVMILEWVAKTGEGDCM
jgi:hypothetical protein